MRLVINVHVKDGLPEQKDEYIKQLSGIAYELLEEFGPTVQEQTDWWLTSVAVQPAPKPLLHVRDL
jgi:hypothetical protein